MLYGDRNPRTKILDFGVFDASRILSIRGGTPRPTGTFPDSLRQAILGGRILVGRLGVLYIYIYIYIYICMYICIYIYIYREREGERERDIPTYIHIHMH